MSCYDNVVVIPPTPQVEDKPEEKPDTEASAYPVTPLIVKPPVSVKLPGLEETTGKPKEDKRKSKRKKLSAKIQSLKEEDLWKVVKYLFRVHI